MKGIEEILEYAKSLVGVPYRWFRTGEPIHGDDKFWAKNGAPISRETIDKENKCIVCTGLINLMRRYNGLEIPGLDRSLDDINGYATAGTTGVWFAYLERKGNLQTLDTNKKYPKGTLLLRDYYDDDTDQGHVAVIIDEKGDTIFDQTILHSYADVEYNDVTEENQNVGQVGYTNFRDSHTYIPDGYYTHVCYPEDWILK